MIQNGKIHDAVLVGSGPSAVTFLYYLNNKKKITVIDYGLTKNSKLEKEDNYQNPRINKNNLFAVNSFKKINNIVTNNFKLIGSMAKGGLSNVWAGGIEDKKLKKFPFLDYYDDSNSLFFRNLKNNISNTNFKLKLKNVIKYKNKIFNSSLLLNDIIKKKKIKYKRNIILRRILKEKKYYKLLCQKNNKFFTILTKKLILATGAIATTKLILDLLKYKEPIKLHHTPQINFLIFLKKNKIFIDKYFYKKYSNFIGYSLTNKKEVVMGSLGVLNSEIINYLSSKFFFFRNIVKFFLNILKNRIIIGNCFFSSQYTNTQIYNKNGTTFIQGGGSYNNNFHENLIATKIFFKSIFLKLSKLILFINCETGSDVHYYGSLASLKLKHKLKKLNNIYIIDSSVLDKKKIFFPTYYSMLNARTKALKFNKLKK